MIISNKQQQQITKTNAKSQNTISHPKFNFVSTLQEDPAIN